VAGRGAIEEEGGTAGGILGGLEMCVLVLARGREEAGVWQRVLVCGGREKIGKNSLVSV
jgi:hypothetical protein